MSGAHARRPTPTLSHRKQPQPRISAWLSASRIDDLCLDGKARVGRAVLTVTPTAPPPPHHVSFSLRRLCLRTAKITPGIGWKRANVGQ